MSNNSAEHFGLWQLRWFSESTKIWRWTGRAPALGRRDTLQLTDLYNWADFQSRRVLSRWTTAIGDYENQPTLYHKPDGSRVSMSYNVENRRVKKET